MACERNKQLFVKTKQNNQTSNAKINSAAIATIHGILSLLVDMVTIKKDKDKWIDAGKREDGERGWMKTDE